MGSTLDQTSESTRCGSPTDLSDQIVGEGFGNHPLQDPHTIRPRPRGPRALILPYQSHPERSEGRCAICHPQVEPMNSSLASDLDLNQNQEHDLHPGVLPLQVIKPRTCSQRQTKPISIDSKSSSTISSPIHIPDDAEIDVCELNTFLKNVSAVDGSRPQSGQVALDLRESSTHVSGLGILGLQTHVNPSSGSAKPVCKWNSVIRASQNMSLTLAANSLTTPIKAISDSTHTSVQITDSNHSPGTTASASHGQSSPPSFNLAHEEPKLTKPETLSPLTSALDVIDGDPILGSFPPHPLDELLRSNPSKTHRIRNASIEKPLCKPIGHPSNRPFEDPDRSSSPQTTTARLGSWESELAEGTISLPVPTSITIKPPTKRSSAHYTASDERLKRPMRHDQAEDSKKRWAVYSESRRNLPPLVDESETPVDERGGEELEHQLTGHGEMVTPSLSSTGMTTSLMFELPVKPPKTLRQMDCQKVQEAWAGVAHFKKWTGIDRPKVEGVVRIQGGRRESRARSCS